MRRERADNRSRLGATPLRPHLMLVTMCLFGVVSATNQAMAQDRGARVLLSQSDVEAIDIGVWMSNVIETPWPVARVSIGEPTVADVEVLSPTQVLIMGNSIGTTNLIMWNENDEAVHVQINVVVDLTHLKAELTRIFPEADLDVVQSRDVLVVMGQLRRVEEISQLREVLDSFGIKYVDKTSVAGVHQVLLQVRIAEVSRERIRALGSNFVYGGTDFFGANRIGSDSGGPLNPTSIVPQAGAPTGNVPFLFNETGVGSSVTLLGGFPGSDLAMFIEALAENQYIRILAQPSLIAMSGEKASFLAGGEFPIPIVQGGGGAGGTSVTVEYKEFGVSLSFEPLVLGDGSIRLHVAPEVSELSEFGAVIIEGFQIPSVLTRRVNTTLELKSGQTFAMAGLLKQSNVARRSDVPGLGGLPILGPLFRSVRYVSGETELVVLVTASLVEPLSTVGDGPVPGDLHTSPNDWELYIHGQMEGKRSSVAPADAVWLKQRGLDRLRGEGAWASYENSADLPPVLRHVDAGATSEREERNDETAEQQSE